MQSSVSHLQVNIQPSNVGFYRDLLGFLGWKTLYDDDGSFGALGSNGVSLWFTGGANAAQNDYDGPGMNHLALGVTAQADVDATAAFLVEHGVEMLFETPRHRPDFSEDEQHTYYQIMFESPDRVLFEVLYVGLKSA